MGWVRDVTLEEGQVRIEIGPGTAPHDGYTGLGPGCEIDCEAQDEWPVPNDSVDQIYASHVLEHIPAGAPRLKVFANAYRVLKPGHTFTVIVPWLRDGTWQAVADPTHVSFFVPESFHYFTGEKKPNADYGIRYFQQVKLQTTIEWPEITWVGRK